MTKRGETERERERGREGGEEAASVTTRFLARRDSDSRAASAVRMRESIARRRFSITRRARSRDNGGTRREYLRAARDEDVEARDLSARARVAHTRAPRTPRASPKLIRMPDGEQYRRFSEPLRDLAFGASAWGDAGESLGEALARGAGRGELLFDFARYILHRTDVRCHTFRRSAVFQGNALRDHVIGLRRLAAAAAAAAAAAGWN